MQRNKPRCTVCRSHNVVSYSKGHKRKCPFLNCFCDICKMISKCLGKKNNSIIINSVETLPMHFAPTITLNVSTIQEPVKLNGFILADQQGEMLFLENNSIPSVTIGNNMYNGFALLEGKFY